MNQLFFLPDPGLWFRFSIADTIWAFRMKNAKGGGGKWPLCVDAHACRYSTFCNNLPECSHVNWSCFHFQYKELHCTWPTWLVWWACVANVSKAQERDGGQQRWCWYVMVAFSVTSWQLNSSVMHSGGQKKEVKIRWGCVKFVQWRDFLWLDGQGDISGLLRNCRL